MVWNPQEMQAVPVLVNKKPLKKHTQLRVYENTQRDDEKKASDKSGSEADHRLRS